MPQLAAEGHPHPPPALCHPTPHPISIGLAQRLHSELRDDPSNARMRALIRGFSTETFIAVPVLRADCGVQVDQLTEVNGKLQAQLQEALDKLQHAEARAKDTQAQVVAPLRQGTNHVERRLGGLSSLCCPVGAGPRQH